MRGILNHVTDSYIWFHTTPKDRLESVLREGLKINSPPTCQAAPEPWIYVSTEPFWMENSVVLEVDLEDVRHVDAGWPFMSGPEKDPEEWKIRWQLRVLVHIPPDRLKLLGATRT